MIFQILSGFFLFSFPFFLFLFFGFLSFHFYSFFPRLAGKENDKNYLKSQILLCTLCAIRGAPIRDISSLFLMTYLSKDESQWGMDTVKSMMRVENTSSKPRGLVVVIGIVVSEIVSVSFFDVFFFFSGVDALTWNCLLSFLERFVINRVVLFIFYPQISFLMIPFFSSITRSPSPFPTEKSKLSLATPLPQV